MVTPTELHVRLTNLQDHFDAKHQAEVVDLHAYVQKLTGVSDVSKFEITETLLTGMKKKPLTKWEAAEIATPVSMLGQ